MANGESSGVAAAYRVLNASKLEAESLVTLLDRHADPLREGGDAWAFLTVGIVGRLLGRLEELEHELVKAGADLFGCPGDSHAD